MVREPDWSTHTCIYSTCTCTTCIYTAHWVIVLHLGLEGCLQPRELRFVDILMYYVELEFRVFIMHVI